MIELPATTQYNLNVSRIRTDRHTSAVASAIAAAMDDSSLRDIQSHVAWRSGAAERLAIVDHGDFSRLSSTRSCVRYATRDLGVDARAGVALQQVLATPRGR